MNIPVGNSYFESLNLTSKSVSAVPEKQISSYDHPNRFVTAITYELPFRGGSKLMHAIVGGWMLNSVYTHQTGQPLIWVNGSTTNLGDYIYSGGPLTLKNRNAISLAFDTSQFNTNAQPQLQYHIRTFRTTFDNLRQDGINQFDGSTINYFNPTETSKLQIRFEVFNLLNPPHSARRT